MKVIITVIVLVFIAVMVIFTMALARMAAEQTDLERMRDDEAQREFLRSWHSRKDGRVNVPDISADGIVHTVEPSENLRKNEKGRFTFRLKRVINVLRRGENRGKLESRKAERSRT